MDIAGFINRASTLHSTLADAIGNPDRVYCRTCGRNEPVSAAHCLRHGWPKCCGYTMTIDKPRATTSPATGADGGEDGDE